MQKYYTAVGRFERKGRMGDMTCPMVIINKREYALDIQEMILWATLNWQIMDAGALEDTYTAKLKASGIAPQRSFRDCMRRLLQRGLVVEGCGETGEDALYALLSGLYVVPISDSLLLRLISFIKLTVFGHVPFAIHIGGLNDTNYAYLPAAIMQLRTSVSTTNTAPSHLVALASLASRERALLLAM